MTLRLTDIQYRGACPHDQRDDMVASPGEQPHLLLPSMMQPYSTSKVSFPHQPQQPYMNPDREF
jgi:hypothetical protein